MSPVSGLPSSTWCCRLLAACLPRAWIAATGWSGLASRAGGWVSAAGRRKDQGDFFRLVGSYLPPGPAFAEIRCSGGARRTSTTSSTGSGCSSTSTGAGQGEPFDSAYDAVDFLATNFGPVLMLRRALRDQRPVGRAAGRLATRTKAAVPASTSSPDARRDRREHLRTEGAPANPECGDVPKRLRSACAGESVKTSPGEGHRGRLRVRAQRAVLPRWGGPDLCGRTVRPELAPGGRSDGRRRPRWSALRARRAVTALCGQHV